MFSYNRTKHLTVNKISYNLIILKTPFEFSDTQCFYYKAVKY